VRGEVGSGTSGTWNSVRSMSEEDETDREADDAEQCGVNGAMNHHQHPIGGREEGEGLRASRGTSFSFPFFPTALFEMWFSADFLVGAVDPSDIIIYAAC